MTTFSFLANNHCGVVAVNVLGWEGSRKGWDCHCCSVSVFIRLQEHDSLYASLRLQPQHRVAGGCVCALPAHSLIHTYVTVLIRSPSLFLTRFLSLLSPVLLISRGGFCFPPEVSEWALVVRALPFYGCQTVSSWDNLLHALIPAHFVQWSCSLSFEWNFTYIQKGGN